MLCRTDNIINSAPHFSYCSSSLFSCNDSNFMHVETVINILVSIVLSFMSLLTRLVLPAIMQQYFIYTLDILSRSIASSHVSLVRCELFSSSVYKFQYILFLDISCPSACQNRETAFGQTLNQCNVKEAPD